MRPTPTARRGLTLSDMADSRVQKPASPVRSATASQYRISSRIRHTPPRPGTDFSARVSKEIVKPQSQRKASPSLPIPSVSPKKHLVAPQPSSPQPRFSPKRLTFEDAPITSSSARTPQPAVRISAAGSDAPSRMVETQRTAVKDLLASRYIPSFMHLMLVSSRAFELREKLHNLNSHKAARVSAENENSRYALFC